jgi:hypothetical protein
MFDASENKQLQLLRFAIIMAMASRMAGETITDSKSADAVADYLAATAEEINFAAGNVSGTPCVVGPGEAPKENCTGYFVNFEADVPLVERRLLNLLLATLPRDRIRKFVDDITKGNFIGGSWNALRAFKDATGGLHVATGSYRTGQEVLVANIKVNPCADGKNETTRTVKDAVACLGLEPEILFGQHPNERKGDKLPKEISDESFEALFQLARTSCVRMPFGDSQDGMKRLKEAAERRNRLCGGIVWEPKPRPDKIDVRIEDSNNE